MHNPQSEVVFLVLDIVRAGKGFDAVAGMALALGDTVCGFCGGERIESAGDAVRQHCFSGSWFSSNQQWPSQGYRYINRIPQRFGSNIIRRALKLVETVTTQ